jgi:hypothetical protein
MEMERSPDKPAKYVIGNFMNAYNLVFPDNTFKMQRQAAPKCLQALFNGKPAWLLETDTKWQEKNLEVLKLILT